MLSNAFTAIGDVGGLISARPGDQIKFVLTTSAGELGGSVVIEKTAFPQQCGYHTIETISSVGTTIIECTDISGWFRARCLTVGVGETLTVKTGPRFEGIDILSQDSSGFITSGRCKTADIPQGVSGYAKGCFLSMSDGQDEDDTFFYNIGSASVANFNQVPGARSKCMFTPEGGFAIKMTNKTGAESVKGEMVTVYTASAINNAVSKIIVNVPNPIGAFYESGIADGSEAWVVVSGIAEVYFIGNTSRGHLARGFVTGDSGYVSGQILSEALPTSPFATDKHFFEIGHVLESRTGAGLAKTVLHFN